MVFCLLGFQPFAQMGAFSFYRGPGPLPSQYLGGKGSHMATKEEAGCTIKVEPWTRSMAGTVSPKLKRPLSRRDGGTSLQSRAPLVTSLASAAAGAPPSIKVAILVVPFLGLALETALYMEMATTTPASSSTVRP